MSTKSTDEFIYFTSKIIRDINGNALSTDNIKLDKILMSDVNLDGKVNLMDSTLIMHALSNPDKYKLSEKQIYAADVYERGTSGITNQDALEIQKYANAGILFY